MPRWETPSGRPLGPSARRRTHRRCRRGSGSPPCCPLSRWPCISRIRMGRNAVDEGVGLVLRDVAAPRGPAGLLSTSTITPFSSAPPPSGSGIPKGDPQGSSRLSAIGTPETRGPGSGCRPRAVPCPQWSRARPPPPTRLQHPRGPHLGEGALAVHHEQRSLAASSVTHDHDLQLFPARARGGGRGRGLWDIHSREPATLAAVRGAEPGVERSQAGAGPRGRGQKNPRPP